jgi:FG-GAP-like repeat
MLIEVVRLDTSPWNLGLPLALLGGCSVIVDLDADGSDGDGSSTTVVTTVASTDGSDPTMPDPTTVPTTAEGSTSIDPTADACSACGDLQCCIDSQCVELGCTPDCPPPQCCYDGCIPDPMCFTDEECGPGALCSYGECMPVDTEPACDEQLGFELQFPLMVGGDIRSLAFIDADGDPLRDVVIGEGSQVRILLAVDGNTVDVQLGAEALDLAIGDLDGDGDEDIAVADHGAGLRVLLHQPDTSFDELPLAELPGVLEVVLADADGDGQLDAFARDELGTVSWSHNLGGGLLEPPIPIFDAATSIAAGTLDGDAQADLVAHQQVEYALSAATMFAPFPLIEMGTGAPSRIVTVDGYGGSGIDDVVALQSVAGTTVATTWTAPVTDYQGYKSWWPGETLVATHADLDDDGYADAIAAAGDFQIMVARGGPSPGNSDLIACVISIPTMAPVLVLAAGDFTGDGRLDLVTSDGMELIVLAQSS